MMVSMRDGNWYDDMHDAQDYIVNKARYQATLRDERGQPVTMKASPSTELVPHKPAAPPKRKTKAEKEAERKDRIQKAEDLHTRRLLELESARGILKRYREVHRMWTVILMSLGLALILSMVMIFFGVDLGYFIGPASVISIFVAAGAKVNWHEKHSLKVMNKDNKLPQTIEYLDPELNVRLAEARYSDALRAKMEAEG